MVGVVVGLKLRILRHTLHGRRAVLFVLGLVYAIVGAAVTALVPLAASDVATATDLIAVFVAVWALGWIVGPVVLGGGDETVRPENFALLPLHPSELARAMGAASLVGTAPVATLLAFTAHVWVGLGVGIVPAVVGILAAVLELGLVVLASRTVVAALSTAIASRRGRDLGVLLASLGALAFLPLQFLSGLLGPILAGGGLGATGTVLRALPTGWGAVAVRSAAAGDIPLTLAPLLGLAVLQAGLLAVWGALLRRRLTTTASHAGPARARRGPSPAPISAHHAGRRPLGAVVGRELRLWRRDARRRSMLLTALVLGLVLPFAWSAGSAAAGAYTALWIAVIGATQLANGYGLDGASMWPLLVVPDSARADVRGRQLAWLAIFGPLVVTAAVAGPVLTGSSSAPVWLAGLVPAVLGAGCGLVVLQSAYLPVALPPGSNPFHQGGSSSGAGCVKGLTALAFLLLLVPVTLPVVAIVLVGRLAGLPALAWAGLPVGAAIGITVAWWWGALAIRRVEAHGPEILAEVRAPAR